QLDRRPHHMRVAAVEAGGDVGRSDEGHDFGVRAERPAPVALAHVAVEVDRPRGHATALSSTPSSAVMNRSISASVIASEHAPRPRWLNRTPSFRSPMNTRSGAAASTGRPGVRRGPPVPGPYALMMAARPPTAPTGSPPPMIFPSVVRSGRTP